MANQVVDCVLDVAVAVAVAVAFYFVSAVEEPSVPLRSLIFTLFNRTHLNLLS